ncbi:MAG: family 16 glycoside hydrolase, partial [Planctomycetota bacterium]
MKTLTLGTIVCLTLCLAFGLFTSLADAHHHGKTQFNNAEDDGWVSLIPEEGFEGWSTKDLDKYWTRKDGMIVGENADKKNSDLFTDKAFGDYELIVEYKNDTEMEYYDSGIFLRGKSHQVQIGISGSLRRASFSTGLLRHARAVAPEGIEVAIADLSEVPLFDEDVE